MATNPLYSASDYALPTTGQTQYDADMAAAKKQAAQVRTLGATLLAEQQQREKKSAEDVYGKALGNMYEGDRALVQQMRDYVQEQQENGGYAKDPVAYQKAVAQLNAMTDNFSSFYNQSYGTDSADGTGNTYADILYNQRTGNDPYEGKGERPVGNPFEDAQSTLNYMQSGGYDPESVYITEEGVMMARTVDTDGNIGEYYPVDQLPHRQLGSQAFMVETVADAAPTLLELAEDESVRASINLAKSRIPTEGEFDLDGFNGRQYDTNMVRQDEKGRNFRRSLLDDPNLAGSTLDITPAEREAFINGNLEGLSEDLQNLVGDGRDKYIEYTRYAGTVEGGSGGSGRGGRGSEGFEPQFIEHTGNIAGTFDLDDTSVSDTSVDASFQEHESSNQVNYSTLAQTIPTLTLTDENNQEFNVEAIDVDHTGRTTVAVPKSTQVIQFPDGTTKPYSELTEEERGNFTMSLTTGDDLYKVVDSQTYEWVDISEDSEDPRATTIRANIGRHLGGGQEYARLKAGIKAVNTDRYNVARKNIEDAQQQAIYAQTVEEGVVPQEYYSAEYPDGDPNYQSERTEESQEEEDRFPTSDPNNTYEQNRDSWFPPNEERTYTDDELVARTVVGTTPAFRLRSTTEDGREGERYIFEGDPTYDYVRALYEDQTAAREDFQRRRDAGELEPSIQPSAATSGMTTSSVEQPTEQQQTWAEDDPEAPWNDVLSRHRYAPGHRGNMLTESEFSGLGGEPLSEDQRERAIDEIQRAYSDVLMPSNFAGGPEGRRNMAEFARETMTREQAEALLDDPEFMEDLRQSGFGYRPGGGLFSNALTSTREEVLADNSSIALAAEKAAQRFQSTREESIAAEREQGLRDIERMNEQMLQDDIKGIKPESSTAAASKLAISLAGAGGRKDHGVARYEGYTPDLQINRPNTANSGVTIAGLDFGTKDGDKKLEKVKPYISDADYKELKKVIGLKGAEADAALKAAQDKGRLTNESLGLTQAELNEITAIQIDSELPLMYKTLPEKNFKKLPLEVQRGVAGVQFNVHGVNALKAVNKAVKSGKKSDWEEAMKQYMEYWSGKPSKSPMKEEYEKYLADNNLTHSGDNVLKYKLEAERIGEGNIKRVEQTARAIAEEYGLTLPQTAEERGVY